MGAGAQQTDTATCDTEVLKSVPLGQRARRAWPRKALEGSREAAHDGWWWRFLVFIIRIMGNYWSTLSGEVRSDLQFFFLRFTCLRDNPDSSEDDKLEGSQDGCGGSVAKWTHLELFILMTDNLVYRK